GSILPAIWSAETTTNQERKQLLRMAIESALIPVCLPLIQFSLKQPERFVQRNRTKIIKNVSALRLGLQHTRFRSAFDDPPIIEQMPSGLLFFGKKNAPALRLYAQHREQAD